MIVYSSYGINNVPFENWLCCSFCICSFNIIQIVLLRVPFRGPQDLDFKHNHLTVYHSLDLFINFILRR